MQAGANLVVLNLSQQTDSSDLLGGFRPVEARDALGPLLPAFSDLVSSNSHLSTSSSTCNCFKELDTACVQLLDPLHR